MKPEELKQIEAYKFDQSSDRKRLTLKLLNEHAVMLKFVDLVVAKDLTEAMKENKLASEGFAKWYERLADEVKEKVSE